MDRPNPERYLKHLFIVGARRVLKRSVSAITESPSSCNREAVARGFTEHGGDYRPLRRIGGNVHQPVGIEAICIVRATI